MDIFEITREILAQTRLSWFQMTILKREAGGYVAYFLLHFFLSVALVLVILLAGIGGGVGGTLAVNKAK